MADRIRNYYLGCPIWANKEWVGSLFAQNAKPKEYLRQYAAVFNSVEGNSTFYALPKVETMQRWKSETPSDFRFSFKFPRLVSHILSLSNAEQETARFLKLVEILEERAGIVFLQLPPSFGYPGLALLEKFLAKLPSEFQYAVEVRHADFFDGGPGEKPLNDLLARYGANRAIFDTSTLQAIESGDRDIAEAQRRKPKMSETFAVTGNYPFLRFVGHKTVEPNLPRLNRLADIVAQWIEEGRHPFVFMHSPDDYYAPHLCRRFHQLLSEKVTKMDIGKAPAWPGEKSQPASGQMSLFE